PNSTASAALTRVVPSIAPPSRSAAVNHSGVSSPVDSASAGVIVVLPDSVGRTVSARPGGATVAHIRTGYKNNLVCGTNLSAVVPTATTRRGEELQEMSNQEGSGARARAVVVTGAASGIGRATARAFAAAGASVVVADVDGDGAAAVARELGGHSVAVRCDVTDLAQVQAAVAAAVDGFGRLDVMVNNAGICV